MDSSKHSKLHKHSKSYRKSGHKPYDISLLNDPDKLDHFTDVALPSKGRPYSVSIAIPASILEETCLKEELRTYLVGQLARSAVIFGVDEIVVYNDHCWKTYENKTQQQNELMELMSTVLEYQECPQYLRKRLCPMSRYLSCAGVLNPTAAPHHLKATQWCPYREGIVTGRNGHAGSYVDVGLTHKVTVSHKTVPEGSRVTVKLPDASRVLNAPLGEIVSPQEPRITRGLYWGYSVRVAHSLADVFNSTDEYDHLIGTSDKGSPVARFKMPAFKKVMIVFGGVSGLEQSVKCETELQAQCPTELFDTYLNVCPDQHARTIRTEEAIPLTLAALMPKFSAANK